MTLGQNILGVVDCGNSGAPSDEMVYHIRPKLKQFDQTQLLYNIISLPLQNIVIQEVLVRLRERVQHVLNSNPPDFDYLDFIVTQEMTLLNAMDNISLPNDIWEAFQQLSVLLDRRNKPAPSKSVVWSLGPLGRLRLEVSTDHLQSLLHLGLPATYVADILGVSRRTMYRRMQEYNMSVRSLYSTITDDVLDNEVRAIKSRLPHAGYQIVKGCLEAQGHHVQWTRLKASMHRVDSEGILSRMTSMGCVVRRKYCVQGPHFLQHIDTNHKLIRCVCYIFGSIIWPVLKYASPVFLSIC